VSFSGFYLAMFLILAALILRPVGFKYRSKRDSHAWRNGWDWALFAGGAFPALLFGVAVGNVILGVPFRLTDNLFSLYEGTFFQLLHPFALLAGGVSLAMLVAHGAAWLTVKADAPAVVHRARHLGVIAGRMAIAGYALAGIWLAFGIDGYALVGPVTTDGPSNPLLSEVAHGGSWLATYAERPWIAVAPVMGFVGLGMAMRGLARGKELSALLWSKLGITGVISSVGLMMFPFILPSSIDPRSSLTVWDASSSHLTLFVMLISTAIFMPLILVYTAWVYNTVGQGQRRRSDAQQKRILRKETAMWYFAWLIGLPLAALFAILNAMWFELREDTRLTED
jgi:cytochrome bd ubiquinol oxidase subunit II